MPYKNTPRYIGIFETLRDRIIYLEYPPEMQLSEKELCEEFNVSRTPLREAVRKLEEMKLVTVIPRFGTVIAPVDIEEVRHAFEIKISLEGLAGALAAKRIISSDLKELQHLIRRASEGTPGENLLQSLISIDRRFHGIIHRSAQNPILAEVLENLHSRCARLWNSALSERIPMADVVGQLESIHLALSERNAEKAEELLKDHVRYFIEKIKINLL
jgi:GntR family transcriptional regulator, rspAB operon transcriptional repressor